MKKLIPEHCEYFKKENGYYNCVHKDNYHKNCWIYYDEAKGREVECLFIEQDGGRF